jgi:hypothetical protein
MRGFDLTTGGTSRSHGRGHDASAFDAHEKMVERTRLEIETLKATA